MRIDRGPRRLAERSIERPGIALAVLITVVLAAAPGLGRLTLRTDGHALVPPRDPAVLFDAEVRDRFELRDPLVVLIETSHPLGIYNRATLARVRDLSSALAALPGVGVRHSVARTLSASGSPTGASSAPERPPAARGGRGELPDPAGRRRGGGGWATAARRGPPRGRSPRD